MWGNSGRTQNRSWQHHARMVRRRDRNNGQGGVMKSNVWRVLALAFGFCWLGLAQAWEPTRNIEFIIPAGTGGGADQMASAIQAIVAKHNLPNVAILPINNSGGARA